MVAENSGGKERPDGLTPRAFASLSHCSARDALIGAKIGRPASALDRIVGTFARLQRGAIHEASRRASAAELAFAV